MAASLAVHALGLMALKPDQPLSARSIARSFNVSEAHLAKILQRLVKVGLLHSVRGTKGGFTLAGSSEETTLLEVFTAIEGPLAQPDCEFGVPLCDGRSCVLGNVVAEANQLLLDYLTRTSLRESSRVFLDGRIELPFELEDST